MVGEVSQAQTLRFDQMSGYDMMMVTTDISSVRNAVLLLYTK
jgi:hypothetical protein